MFNGDNGISVTSTIPSSMAGGKEVTLEITVNKGAMNGFAKLQLDLPAEFEVKSAEEKGATYTYNEGIAKWVWAVLPSENEIVIKVVVVPSAANLGPKTISAKYSYVENNVKQVVEMVPVEVNVLSEVDFAAGNNPNPSTASNASLSVPDTSAKLAAAVTSNIETPGNISIKRKIERLSSTDFEVSLSIAKGSTKGFARYSDLLPPDVSVKGNKMDGASFSLADGKIKFVWVNVPEKDTLHISYVISSSRIQVVEIKGEYSYLEDNQSKNQEAEYQSIAFETPATIDSAPKSDIASDEKKNADLGTIAKKDSTPPTKQPETKPVIARPDSTAVAKGKSKKSPTAKKPAAKSTPAPSTVSSDGMVYHVQIGAFTKRKVTAEKLEKKFNVTESISSEMAEGYTKFMVGTHIEYKDARDHREKMIAENKIKSSFVVAYNQGKRITVQEALSITNQKWYK
jgi:hypothetical protein